MQIPILSLITWLPTASALIVSVLPNDYRRVFKSITLITLLLQGLCIIWIIGHIKTSIDTEGQTCLHNLQFIERVNWIRFPLGNSGILSINYFLGVDGLNISLLGLAIIVLSIGAIASWSIHKYVKAYFILYLLLNTLIIGSLLAMDFLLFYIFFEITLIPIYFFIGFWGDKRGPYAATKFFLYTLIGTIMLLVVIIGLSFSTYDPVDTGIQAQILQQESVDPDQMTKRVQKMVQANQIAPENIVHTLDISLMADKANFIPNTSFHIEYDKLVGGHCLRLIGFILLLLGFLIKLAIVPLHSWLPDAHVQAPTPISILLGGILLKIGAYGILRTAYTIFPEGAIQYASWIGIIGIFSTFYIAFNALAAQDLKKMIAYSSIAHMSLFLIGIGSLTAEGMQGALYNLVSHGLIISLLFLVAEILYSRTKDRTINNYSGLASCMPNYTIISLITFAAAIGVPGFSGFIAELLILLGAFRSPFYQNSVSIWIGILAVVGILLNTIYYIWTIQRIFGGKFCMKFSGLQTYLTDINIQEKSLMIALTGLIVILGVYPNLLLNLTIDAVTHLVSTIYKEGSSNLQHLLMSSIK